MTPKDTMFTGIIEALGIVKSIERKSGSLRLTVVSGIFAGQKIGDSIAVNGACLTIAGLKNDLAEFDIMQETLARSTLGSLKAGDRINLERALKAGDRLGGHFVTGHIDCVGRISDRREDAGSVFIKIKIPTENMKFLVAKGSVALDGISLTVADIGKDDFTAHLIPHTLNNTTLSDKKTGDELNIEFDMLGKYVLNSPDARQKKSAITESFLKEKGFG